MGNRQQRRQGGKPQGMSLADKIAREKRLREAAQLAANNIAVQLKSDIQTQKMAWLIMRALNKGFNFGKKSFEKLTDFINESTEWYNGLVAGADEDYANEKLRQDVERFTHQEVEFAWEEELLAARKRHENDKVTNFEKFRVSDPQKMAETMCGWLECQKCPGRELCSHKDGKANGLVKWFEQEVSLHE